MIKKLLAMSLSAAGLFAVASEAAYAYLDPGTGSMLLQALIGAVAGAWIVLRLYWDKIKGFFSRFGRKRKSPENISSVDENP